MGKIYQKNGAGLYYGTLDNIPMQIENGKLGNSLIYTKKDILEEE